MKAYLVGGAVRDQLLGIVERGDCDWVVVGGTEQQLLDAGYQRLDAFFPVFLHPQTKEEYALARTEKKVSSGYRGFTWSADSETSLEMDLQRRDLTINAMARDDTGELVDPYGGLRDLQQRVLRHVSPAFAEDPLRVLRVARFHSRYYHLGFRIAPETMDLMRTVSLSGELQDISAERLWRETERALNEDNPEAYFNTLHDVGALEVLAPELVSVWASACIRMLGCSKSRCRFYALASLCGHQKPVPQLWVRAPADWQRVAGLIGQVEAVYCADHPLPEAALAVMEQLDMRRRPQRFADILSSLEQITGYPMDAWQRRAERVAQVDVQQLLAFGLKGSALAAALRDQRLRALR